MAMSGVTVSDECIVEFQNWKTKKMYRYLVFTIKNSTEITVQEKGARNETFDQFVAKFDKDAPAYGAFDFEYETKDGPREKLILITWIPDTSKPRARMLYSSSKIALDNLDSALLSIQANDASQLTFDAVLQKVTSSRAA